MKDRYFTLEVRKNFRTEEGLCHFLRGIEEDFRSSIETKNSTKITGRLDIDHYQITEKATN